jgi:hypothetical protein
MRSGAGVDVAMADPPRRAEQRQALTSPFRLARWPADGATEGSRPWGEPGAAGKQTSEAVSGGTEGAADMVTIG